MKYNSTCRWIHQELVHEEPICQSDSWLLALKNSQSNTKHRCVSSREMSALLVVWTKLLFKAQGRKWSFSEVRNWFNEKVWFDLGSEGGVGFNLCCILSLFCFFHDFKQDDRKRYFFLKASLNSRYPAKLSTKEVFLLLMCFHPVLIRIPKCIWTQPPPPPHRTHWRKKEHFHSSSFQSVGEAIFKRCMHRPDVGWAYNYKFWPQ